MILPGATLGVVGGGQLGRMFALSARVMGYRVVVLDPDAVSPAGQAADGHICAAYDDAAALDRLARECAAVTTEFENVPAATLDRLARTVPVRPGGAAVAVAQDRIREKTALAQRGFATAPFRAVTDLASLESALREVPLPALLKTSRLGYDGKGQATIERPGDAAAAFARLGAVPCVLERR
ncbi:MAG TPA: ATP-grasp domain-containing protein, partial [Gemmatimonadales bacterium]|nr:ATP-grasp domain-containing protein [Gemmatimonadales bacterium]